MESRGLTTLTNCAGIQGTNYVDYEVPQWAYTRMGLRGGRRQTLPVTSD